LAATMITGAADVGKPDRAHRRALWS